MRKMYEGKEFSPKTTLTTNIGAADTVITVDDVTIFLPGPNLATIGSNENMETIQYTVIAGNSLSGCERGKEGVAQAWTGGTAISRNFTNLDYEAMRQNIETSVQKGTDNAQYIQFTDGETFQGKYDSGELTGQQGEQGKPGRTPERGVDYFTEADKEEMVAAVIAALPANTALAARMEGA